MRVRMGARGCPFIAEWRGLGFGLGGEDWSSGRAFPPTARRHFELQEQGGVIACVVEVAGAREETLELGFDGGGRPSARCST